MHSFEILYLRIRKNKWMSLLVIWIRYLIGFAFVPSGYTKLMGNRFTNIPVSNPIGFFFEGLYQSGIYWNFLGLVQVLAAFLLMTQRFATLGNFIFLPLVTNIFIITYALHFKGTVFITGLMLFASICLMLWDYPKWKYILSNDHAKMEPVGITLPSYNQHWIRTGLIFFLEASLMSLQGHFFAKPAFTFFMLGLMFVTGLVSLGIYFNRDRKIRRISN